MGNPQGDDPLERSASKVTRYHEGMTQTPDGIKRLDGALRETMRSNLDLFERRPSTGEGLVAAAVTLLLTDDESGNACFIITRRARGLGKHPGQWALPGGRLDAGESPEQAALRETREEIGHRADPDSILGLLDDYPTRSGFVITPVVVWAGAQAELTANPAEVAEIHRVPLTILEAPEVPRLRSIPESERPVISVPMLGTNVHAPTAAILYQLREVAVLGRQTRVDHFEQPLFAWK